MLSDVMLYAFRSSLHPDTYRKGRCHELLGSSRDGSADATRDSEGMERGAMAKAANRRPAIGDGPSASSEGSTTMSKGRWTVPYRVTTITMLIDGGFPLD
jgi:hypothetical protein